MVKYANESRWEKAACVTSIFGTFKWIKLRAQSRHTQSRIETAWKRVRMQTLSRQTSASDGSLNSTRSLSERLSVQRENRVLAYTHVWVCESFGDNAIMFVRSVLVCDFVGFGGAHGSTWVNSVYSLVYTGLLTTYFERNYICSLNNTFFNTTTFKQIFGIGIVGNFWLRIKHLTTPLRRQTTHKHWFNLLQSIQIALFIVNKQWHCAP